MNLSPGNIFVAIVFSLVGFSAYLYGKRNAEPRPLVIGVVLMLYGYFVSNPWVSFGVGVLLTGLIFYP